ncbi:MAG: TonB-dependent receptor [Saprospiraceae bacterium]|nr:TonB-dependent receptor [Saprospiraceae bacterium]
MYRILCKTLFLMGLPFWLFSQDNVTLSGTISEAETGETLIGATVLVEELNLGTSTNEYGFFSLSVPKGKKLTVIYSYVGFNSISREITLQQDEQIDIELSSGVNLDEVVVKANSFEEQLRSTEMSVEEISTKEAKLVPVIFGESDILKTIQLKPGIPSGSEGTTGLFVRGGGSDQNLIVLDEAVVYNANHLFGFFSTFNTDAVKDLKIYKGGFPAQYGGRLSSVIDVKLKEGNSKKFAGSGGIGLISSRLTLEGPIQEDKSSFMVSGRRTYVDIFTRLANDANEGNEDFTPIPDYYFYDLNTKINFKFGEKDRLFLSGYFGRDVFGFSNDFFNFDFDWGNATGTARWNHIFNSKLFANTTFTYSDYQYNIENRITGFSFKVGSNIQDATLKTDFYYAINNKNTIRFGATATYHQFTVGRLQAGSTDGDIQFSAGQDFDGIQAGAYVSDEITFSPRFKANVGLRLSGFFNDGSNYFGLEPRAALNYTLNPRVSFKASYAKMYQYLHLVANSGIALPTDIWYPSTENVKPQASDQFAIGGSYLLNRSLFFNIEAYYKLLDNQIEFVDGAQLFANDNLEQEFAIGKGRSYGLEFSIEKKEGALTGWIGYTLSWTRRGDFTLLDDNQFFEQSRYGDFAPIYDRRHDISVVAIYEINRRLTATATFVYGSGDLRWLPNGRYTFQDIYGQRLNPVVPVYEDRNNFRLPAYHRLDLGLVIKFFPKWGESDLTINVINAYDRRNTFFIYLEPETVTDPLTNIELPTRIVANQVSLFPILPSLTWNFKF